MRVPRAKLNVGIFLFQWSCVGYVFKIIRTVEGGGMWVPLFHSRINHYLFLKRNQTKRRTEEEDNEEKKLQFGASSSSPNHWLFKSPAPSQYNVNFSLPLSDSLSLSLYCTFWAFSYCFLFLFVFGDWRMETGKGNLQEQQKRQQLTIFYNGRICVCDVTELQVCVFFRGIKSSFRVFFFFFSSVLFFN